MIGRYVGSKGGGLRYYLWCSCTLFSILTFAALQISVQAAVHFVDVQATNSTPPFLGWSTAAINIQDAIDVSDPGDQILVSDGVYRTGGTTIQSVLTNRVALTKPLTLQSLNGPQVTRIEGYIPSARSGDDAVRCVYLTNGAALIGFTLTNGATRDSSGDPTREQSGAGAWCEGQNSVISNCILVGNVSWSNGAGVVGGTVRNTTISDNNGGGAYQSLLIDCVLVNNSGGGAANCSLSNCVVTANSSKYGGGILGGTATACTFLNNSALFGGAASSATLSDCTVTGNWAEQGGGGTEACAVFNCTVCSNSAYFGGGVLKGTINNSTIICNTAVEQGGASQSVLIGCMISSNSVSDWGGGASVSKLTNCTLVANTAAVGGGGADSCTLDRCAILSNYVISATDGSGGGTSVSTLNNCVLIGNSATVGGAASKSTLNNCTVTANAATRSSGGTADSTLLNCIVYFNTAPDSPNYNPSSEDPDYPTSLDYCCTTPLPTVGQGSITNPPGFIDLVSGNLHLQAASACINAGKNSVAVSPLDFDSLPRIVGGTVDIGAYEFQYPKSLISYEWLQRFGFPQDGSADFTDADGDGHNNWQEWIAGTDPTNNASVLKIISATPTSAPASIIISWQSVTGRNYDLQRSTSLSLLQPAFSVIQTNIPGQAAITSSIDTNIASGATAAFYRVMVH